MSAKRRYKIINDTIRPIKLNSKGQDIRPNRDRTGSAVQFYVGEGSQAKLVTIYQNKSTIVDELSDPIIRLHKKGRIIIETINDITDELRNFAVKPEPGEVFKNSLANTASEPKPLPSDIKARAVPSGAVSSEDRLVNPDGEPNFVAKAPRGGLKRKVEQPKEDTSTESPEVL